MHSNRPYLLRAFYEWIADNGCTPILVVDANYPGCKVPRDYVEGGEIVFNISISAVRDLKIANDFIEFKASFSGVIHFISAPISSALALYAEENGEGIFLDAEEGGGTTVGDHMPQHRDFDMDHTDHHRPGPTIDNVSKSAKKGKPFLRLVE